MIKALDDIFKDGKVDFKEGLEKWAEELESGKMGNSEEVAGFAECMKVGCGGNSEEVVGSFSE